MKKTLLVFLAAAGLFLACTRRNNNPRAAELRAYKLHPTQIIMPAPSMLQ